jgi:transcription elongation factor GreA
VDETLDGLPPEMHFRDNVCRALEGGSGRTPVVRFRPAGPQYFCCASKFASGKVDATTMDALANIKAKLQAEINQLEHELNLELPKEISVARAHGDLSENAEYKYAKERQGFVSARLGQLKKRMGDLGMLNINNIPADKAGYGSRVWLRDLNRNSEIEYKLVTSEEADAAQGLISTTSPIGRALLGRKRGDEVKVQTPAGVKEFEVIQLKTIHDE